MTTFRWRSPGIYGCVDPTDAGDLVYGLIAERGAVTAADLVEESRAPGAVLHPLFEWDDAGAAVRWREQQGSDILRNLVFVRDATPQQPDPPEIRACVPFAVTPTGHRGYVAIETALHTPTMMDELVRRARAELASFERKYAMLKDEEAFAATFAAIRDLNEGRPPTRTLDSEGEGE